MLLCKEDKCADTRTIELVFTDTTPQEVTVQYNPDAIKLDITEENLIIKSVVDTTESTDEDFKRTGMLWYRYIAFRDSRWVFLDQIIESRPGLTFRIPRFCQLFCTSTHSQCHLHLLDPPEQSIDPISIKLIPEKHSASAKSVTIVPPPFMSVAEGPNGFSAEYDIYLRPCTTAMRDGTFLSITQSIEGQVTLSTDHITGDDWLGDGNCKVTVNVTAVDDDILEGDHFVSLRHNVTTTSGNEILLSDDSVLYASNVLVRIYDDDIAGVMVEESLGYTATAEIDSTKASSELLSNPSLFEDSYKIRLSKQPSQNVTIIVNSIATVRMNMFARLFCGCVCL